MVILMSNDILRQHTVLGHIESVDSLEKGLLDSDIDIDNKNMFMIVLSLLSCKNTIQG
jgi:hypothetical protein